MDLARAKGEVLVNTLIIYSTEKYNRVMLNGVGNENGKKQQQQQQQQLCTCSTLFCTFICRCCLCSCSLFFLCRSFSPCWSPLASISHFLTAGIKFSCCCSNEIRLRRFLSLDLALCRSFSRWASLACRLLSRFLCLSLSRYSKFVDMTINLSITS